MKRLVGLTALAVALAASSAHAQQINVKIGVLSDMGSLPNQISVEIEGILSIKS